MNQKILVKIDSILGGIAPTFFGGSSSQFKSSTAIDPDLPVTTTTTARQSGFLVPAQYATFATAATLATAPKWITTNPKDANFYVYCAGGRFLSYDSAFGTETNIGTPTSGAGNGMAYYNNYIYLATPTDISRYGPLIAPSGSPAIANTFWTSTLSKTALGNMTYPTAYQTTYPNHVLFPHSDGKLYILDCDPSTTTDTTRGKGLIHYIKTKFGTSGTAHEGAVDDASVYNALDLPMGFVPTCIAAYGTDLAIGAIQWSSTGDNTLRQGNAALFFWDTSSDSFYRQVPLYEPLVTALLNANGRLFVFSGNLNNGVSVGVYDGAYGVTGIEFFESGFSPFASAVDYYGGRVIWGVKDGIRSIGYKNPRLPQFAVHHIMKTSSAGTNPAVTCARYIQQASGVSPRAVVGWSDDSTRNLERLNSSGTIASVFDSQMVNIGRQFRVLRIRIPLTDAVGANMSIVPTIRVDDNTTVHTLPTINNTNFANSERQIVYQPEVLETVTAGGVVGKHNFFLRLTWSGTATLSIAPPITIEVELTTDVTQ